MEPSQTIAVIAENRVQGRGEGPAMFCREETLEAMQARIHAVARELEEVLSPTDLLALLPLPSEGARNAVDCAPWDLEAKRSEKRAWQLAGLESLSPVESDITIGLNTPGVTADAGRSAPLIRRLKLKLGCDGDVDRAAAAISAQPDERLTVDPSQAWSPAQLEASAPRSAELCVELIEQPLPVGGDDALLGFNSVVPLCTDDSCQTVESLPSRGLEYGHVNIKPNQTGGLTAALTTGDVRAGDGYGRMVGCLGRSALSMAPAMVVAAVRFRRSRYDVADVHGPAASNRP